MLLFHYVILAVKIASCRAETGMRNGKNAGNAPPPSRPGSEQRQSEQAQNWRDVRKMTQGQLDTAETLLFSVDECAMSLVFSNQSTQLRDGKVSISLWGAVPHSFKSIN